MNPVSHDLTSWIFIYGAIFDTLCMYVTAVNYVAELQLTLQER